MAKLCIAGEGITLECLPPLPHRPEAHLGFAVVSLAIVDRPTDSPPLTSHLHLTVHPGMLNPNIAAKFQSVTLPFTYVQTVSDPSILHLLQLLQTEIHTPQPMNQLFISSIVTVLITHILQNLCIAILE